MFTSQVQVHKFSPAIPELEVLRQEDCEFQTNLNCRGKTMFMVGRTTLKHGSLLPLHCCVPLSPFHSLLHAAMKIQEDVQQTLHWCHCMVPRRPWINACPSGLDIKPCWWGARGKGISRLSWRTLFSQVEGVSGKGKEGKALRVPWVMVQKGSREQRQRSGCMHVVCLWARKGPSCSGDESSWCSWGIGKMQGRSGDDLTSDPQYHHEFHCLLSDRKLWATEFWN